MRIENLPIAYYKRGMPNICQTNPRNGYLREEGRVFCGPTSVANALIWLSKHHFRSLLPPIGNQTERTAGLKLVEELAENIESEEENGTPVYKLISGVRQYVRDRGYRVETHWKGVEHNEEYHCSELDSLEWIMGNMLGTSNVILDIEFRRTNFYNSSLHYVTLSGFNRKHDEFYVHDPSRLTRITPEVCEIEEVQDGHQIGGLTRRYGPSEIFFKINEYNSNDIEWRENVANLIGAIAFRVFRK